jgi:hypothetical protein
MWVGTLFGRNVMRKQILAAAAMLCFFGGTSGSYAFDKDQTPWIDMILKNAEQLSKNPNFGQTREENWRRSFLKHCNENYETTDLFQTCFLRHDSFSLMAHKHRSRRDSMRL